VDINSAQAILLPYPVKKATIAIMVANIDSIRQKFGEDQFEFSKHAVDQSLIRRILVQEVREAVANGLIIEDYPNDKYGPSCLILGFTQTQRPLHIQCSYPSRPIIKIITLYEPQADKWNSDFTVRR
jgi:hypothetical protein